MIQKQKIEAHYLKLISVTLMMTASCIADAKDKAAYSLYDDHIREIILEQFQNYSASHWAEVIEWDHAIQELKETDDHEGKLVKVVYYKVLEVPSYKLQYLSGIVPTNKTFVTGHISSCCKDFSFNNQWHPTENRNAHSLITRAGPNA